VTAVQQLLQPSNYATCQQRCDALISLLGHQDAAQEAASRLAFFIFFRINFLCHSRARTINPHFLKQMDRVNQEHFPTIFFLHLWCKKNK